MSPCQWASGKVQVGRGEGEIEKGCGRFWARTYFFEKNCRVPRFDTLSLEIPDKMKPLSPRKIPQNCATPLGTWVAKNRPKTETFLISPGSTSSFLIDLRNFHIIFFQYTPQKCHVFHPPPCLEFFSEIAPIAILLK